MNTSHELLNEYVACQALALFAQQKEVDKLKVEIEKLKTENDGLKDENKRLGDANRRLVDENLGYAVKLRNTESSMNIYKAVIERMRGTKERRKVAPYGVEIISTGEYRDGRVETNVGWSDGTITKVWLAKGEENDPYVAFTAALAKKVYGSNSAVHRIVNSDNNSHFVDL